MPLVRAGRLCTGHSRQKPCPSQMVTGLVDLIGTPLTRLTPDVGEAVPRSRDLAALRHDIDVEALAPGDHRAEDPRVVIAIRRE